MMYVIMDGFDLGIGILFPFVRDRDDRDTMVNTVAPVWDGNETWLVLGRRRPAGGLPARLFGHPERALSAAHPDAGRTDLARRRLRVPLQGRRGAQAVLGQGLRLGLLSSPTFSQGVALGAFINGFKVADGAYAGGALRLADAVSACSPALGVVVAYALLGAPG